MQKELDLFSNLFEESPNIAILHINNKVEFINSTVKKIAKDYEGEINFINFQKESFKLKVPARQYEYAILSDILFYSENQTNLLKSVYRSLENSANIIILEKISNNNLQKIKELLEQIGFLAVNHIDLFQEFNLITAKKMHMWGNGL